MRSASWIVLGYGASQAIRLASNLILTRLLFPEAFGLMALISVITVGLTLFSDVGIAPSIAQSKRGDDPPFLNTAWTIQVARGFLLWGLAWLLAAPVAAFYGQADLAVYLPIAAMALAIQGFSPTRIETAHRHLLMGRVTALDLISQVIGIAVMIVLAVIWQSVAALVVGGVVQAVARLVLMHFGLPGVRNRFGWEPAAGRELVSFGKWIFLSTLFWFFASQGDKAILGKFLTLESLGIYNIGYFLASFPLLLGLNVTGRVMIPVYREGAAPARVSRLRYALSAGVIGLLMVMALLGPWLTDLLYDARYGHAGGIIVILSVALIPQVIGMTYDQAALAAGDSRRFFMSSAARSSLQVGFLLIGAAQAGVLGAMIGMGLALLISHAVLIWLARVHGVWDAPHDLVWAVLGLSVGMLALWLHWDAIAAMAAATV
ncbi:oligosaccharide flippase family protein [Sulfitobacter sp. TSTF-M16]|uniref:Oligosaccharide flippase family protein n=1 Tax=Sulfitobacter aestuariivivens TaxID=2766981 RepID=A0A927D313_9RHOB|nr:oligosaccharide flippase family protein [Sulfitobacter aestuariivivens]MBD3662402.1 oligosaccharide flippase family protein [Sulfitobacter aestuariivivens]